MHHRFRRLARTAGLGWAATAVLLAVLVVLLRLEGRAWWCSSGDPGVWVSDAWSSHTSQHLLDPYAFTHVLHGLVFWWVIAWIWREGPAVWQASASVLVEAAWEAIENSNAVIDRYRTATAALGYTGDTVANALGDTLCCALGFWVARRVGWIWSAALFAATELALLITIRDCLLLNVLMLLYPIDAIRQWQVGHG
jgi:hypothetical protein